MKPWVPILLALSFSTSAPAQRVSLGVFAGWGAFRDPTRCYAITEPAGRERESRPFASVGWWPAQGARGQVHIRLSRPAREGSAILLKIDDQVFQLAARGRDAFADRRDDRRILAAMRVGVTMIAETRSESGARIGDRYRLAGAATALDAAAFACAR